MKTSTGRPKSRHDNAEMPLRCHTPLCFNAATGRREGRRLVCDACAKREGEAADEAEEGYAVAENREAHGE